jgi:hypothetical protein
MARRAAAAAFKIMSKPWKMSPDSAWSKLTAGQRGQLGKGPMAARWKERETSGNKRTPEARISRTAVESVQAISAYFTLFQLVSTIFLFFHEASKTGRCWRVQSGAQPAM